VIVLFGDGKFGPSRGHGSMPNKALMECFGEVVPTILIDEFLTSSVSAIRNLPKRSAPVLNPECLLLGVRKMFCQRRTTVQKKAA
jgi:hypothetical protein